MLPRLARLSAKTQTRPQESAEPPHGLTEVNTLQLVLPDTNDPPSVLSELLGLSDIAFDVGRDLLGPPCRVCLRYPEVQAATVPEAAIHKDTDHLARKYDVGLAANSGYRTDVLPEPQARSMECRSQQSLRTRIPTSIGPHHAADQCRGRGRCS